jgi:hypothetical protein
MPIIHNSQFFWISDLRPTHYQLTKQKGQVFKDTLLEINHVLCQDKF